MGTICRLLTDAVTKRSGTYAPEQWLIDWFGSGDESQSDTGIRITHDNALKHTPFWSAVRIISGTLAALPFKVYESLEAGGKKPRREHGVYRLLHDRPNEYMDSLTFIESRQAHVLTYGNGYAEIERDGYGRPVALWPLMPQPERTKRAISDSGKLFYQVRTPDGRTFNLPDYNVLHIKGLGFDGYTGYDVVTYHKETIAYGKAVKKYGARFFANGANVGGVLEHPNKIGDTALKHLKESLKLEYEGLSQAHRTMILEEGMKFNKTGIEPEKAQALEAQKWSVDDCSRIFQIPPHKLASMEFSKYNNVEQLQIDFVVTTMLYWFKKWEQECNYKLFTPKEQKNLFCQIVVDGLLRGDIKTRTDALWRQFEHGVLTIDQWCELENRNPVGGEIGSTRFVAANLIPAQLAVEGKGGSSAGSEPAGSSGAGDPVRAAHVRWLGCQWLRIIKKQNNALAGGANGDFYQRQREYARLLLAEPAAAYASCRNIEPSRADSILAGFINQVICIERKLDESEAVALAERTIEQIGGDHAE